MNATTINLVCRILTTLRPWIFRLGGLMVALNLLQLLAFSGLGALFKALDGTEAPWGSIFTSPAVPSLIIYFLITAFLPGLIDWVVARLQRMTP